MSLTPTDGPARPVVTIKQQHCITDSGLVTYQSEVGTEMELSLTVRQCLLLYRRSIL